MGNDNSQQIIASKFKAAYQKTINIVNQILAPLLVVIGIIEHSYKINEFIEKHRTLIAIFSATLGLIFLSYLLNIGSRFFRFFKQLKATKINYNFKPKFSKKGLLIITSALFTTVATVLVIFILTKFSFTGAHYIMVASHEEQKARQVVNSINKLLTESSETTLTARAYPSDPPNPYYSIILGEVFSSKMEAFETFHSVRHIIENQIAKNPQIISYYPFRGRIWKDLSSEPIIGDGVNDIILKNYKIDIYYDETSAVDKKIAKEIKLVLEKEGIVRNVLLIKINAIKFLSKVGKPSGYEVRYDAWREFDAVSILVTLLNNKCPTLNIQIKGVGNETPNTLSILIFSNTQSDD